MTTVYALLYINVDEPSFSEVVGLYSTKDSGVNALLKVANYREKNGKLTQYMKTTDEYESYSVLRALVMKNMELNDVDIYRLIELQLECKRTEEDSMTEFLA